MKTIKVKLSDLPYWKLQAIEKITGLNKHNLLDLGIETQEETNIESITESRQEYIVALRQIIEDDITLAEKMQYIENITEETNTNQQ